MHKRRWLLSMAAPLLLLWVALGALAAGLVWPAEGTTRVSSGGLEVDYSNAADGYIRVKAPKSQKSLKLQLKCGKETYNHDINNTGEWAVYPLQMGSGSYTAALYQQVSGNKYNKKAGVSFRAEIPNADACFLCPSVYVWYTPDSPAVAKSEELCKGLTTDQEKLDAITEYLRRNLVYDYIRSVQQRTPYFGDVDGTLQTRKGLCQDFAAVAAAMLRVQGIPTKLAIGELSGPTGKQSHAWNYVLIDGEYKRLDLAALITNTKNHTYTAEKYY